MYKYNISHIQMYLINGEPTYIGERYVFTKLRRTEVHNRLNSK